MTTATEAGRWRLLEEERALTMPEWLPPEDAAPELSKLREEHLRLLAAQAEAARAAAELRRSYEGEDERHEAELREALAQGRDPAALVGSATPPEEREERLREADRLLRAANDVLVAFLVGAVAQIKEMAPVLYEALAARLAAAEEKRAEAQRLLEEADLAVRATVPLRAWLDRTTEHGSVLGHFPFGWMEIPPKPEQPDWAEVLAGGSVMEVQHA